MLLKAILALFVCLAPAVGSDLVTPKPLEAENQRAIALATQGRLDEAMERFRLAYTSALEAGERQLATQAAGYLGGLYRFQGQPARAIPLLRFAKQQFAAGSADAAVVIAQLGAALAQDGQMAAAERELRSAGDNSSAQAHLAAVLVERKKSGEAELILRRVLRDTGGSELATVSVRAFAHLTLARLLSGTQPAEAEVHFRAAVADYSLLPIPVHPDRMAAEAEYDLFGKRCRAALE